VSTAEIATTESVIARAAKMASLPQALEKAVIQGDLTYLTVEDRVKFYSAVCNSLGLNPLTKPFLYVQLNGKLTLYASKDATDQLRKIHGVSVTKLEKSYDADVYCVTAYGCDKAGRTDASTGAVTLPPTLKGEARANAVMKAETKAKRRLTLSLCGLGMLDETEVEAIPTAKRVDGEAEVISGDGRSETASVSDRTSVAVSDGGSAAGDARAPRVEPGGESGTPETRPAYIDADGVVEDKPKTAAEATTNGYAQVRERMTRWSPEAQAAIPPEELWVMPEDEAEQNREFYIAGIRDAAKRHNLSTKEQGDRRELFFGSRNIQLAHANIYALRALWIELNLDQQGAA
jgi:hypothetical protein